jgi:tRNA A37 threonylcarbamoyladenosine modification protein TsaB
MEFREMLGEQFIELPVVFDSPRADLLAELAARQAQQGLTLQPEQLLPQYLGPSQAEVNWKKRQKQ